LSTKTVAFRALWSALFCLASACAPSAFEDDGEPAMDETGRFEIQSARIPRVTAVNPPLVSNIGGTGITITGRSFAPGAQVFIGGEPAAYAYVNSSTQITTGLAQKALPVGPVAIKVVNPDGRQSERSDVLSLFNDNVALVALRASLQLSGFQIVAVTDLTGDGKLDLLTSDGYSRVWVYVWRGRGDYVESQTLPLSAAMGSVRVESGDVNGDGKLDLIIGSGFSPPLSAAVFLGRGDGTFGAPVTTALTTLANFSSGYVGDVNGDGRADLVIAGNSAMSLYGLFVFPGGSDGRFGTPIYSTVGSFLGEGKFADVNGDGKRDLLTSSPTTSEVYFMAGSGDGRFATAVASSVDALARRFVLVDVNGDGKLDLASLGTAGKLSIRTGRGDGTFGGGTVLTVSEAAFGLDAADLSGDGKADLLVGVGQLTSPMGPPMAGAALLYAGNGDATFQTPRALNIAPLQGADGVRIADVDKDGKLDLFLGNTYDGARMVVYGRGGGTFVEDLQLPSGCTALFAADLNGDGRGDVAVVSVGSNKLYVSLANSDGTLGPPRSFDTDRAPSAVASADVTGDGKLDLLVSNYDAATVSLLPGNGDGTFSPQRIANVGAGVNALVAQDLNGDGRLDVVTANYEANTVSVLINNGAGGFNAAKHYSTGSGSGPVALAVGDFNGDGRNDVVTANADNSTVSYLQGSAVTAGALNAARALGTGKGPNVLAARDWNGDGKLDVITGNGDSGDVSLITGKGDGTFNAVSVLFQSGHVADLAVADLSGDGRADVVLSGSSSGRITVLYSFAGGVFSPSSRSVQAGGPIATPDLNGDGKLDLLVGQTSGTLLTYMNTR
jgi:hypothetical protein